MMRKKAAALLLAALMAAAPVTASAAAKKKAPESSGSSQVEVERPAYAVMIMDKINAERDKEGLPHLEFDDKLEAAARVRAKECAEVFDSAHTRPDGSSYVTAFDEAGVTYTYWGENTAEGYDTADEVVKAWMASDAHKANILSEKFTAAGVGYHKQGDDIFWVLDFTGVKAK